MEREEGHQRIKGMLKEYKKKKRDSKKTKGVERERTRGTPKGSRGGRKKKREWREKEK